MEAFVAAYGGVYEASPWVAQGVFLCAPDLAEPEKMAAAMRSVVNGAGRDRQLALMRAHPELAVKTETLSAHSRSEQARAGLSACTPAEAAEFAALNARYRKKFGFPFIIAVAGLGPKQILAAFRRRIENGSPAEFAEALEQIHRIAGLRLSAMARGESRPALDFAGLVNLAQARLGARVVFATDDFFADKARLIAPGEPVFIPDKYDAHGKWMDGWESRRKRVPGHDFCIVRLARPGRIAGFEIDTRHFTGNYPPFASIEACASQAEIPGEDAPWREIVPRTPLEGDSRLRAAALEAGPFTHVRLHIYPDGGVARLKVFGRVVIDWTKMGGETVDLAALELGGRAIGANDEHFGRVENMLAPGRGANMGDGWETRRRRTPGHDWAVVELAHPGIIERILVDTAHFKGNYPDRCSLQAFSGPVTSDEALLAEAEGWPLLLPEMKLEADREHVFAAGLRPLGAVRHVRLNIFPDGGVSRLRLFGRPA
jgi:allantoicase